MKRLYFTVGVKDLEFFISIRRECDAVESDRAAAAAMRLIGERHPLMEKRRGEHGKEKKGNIRIQRAAAISGR